MSYVPRWSFALMLPLLPLAAGVDIATAQNGGSPVARSSSCSPLSPVDYNFVAEANLGAPFQVDSGRLAEEKATTAAIRDYAQLMVATHIPVIDALNAILQNKSITAPPDSLLHGAYDAMITSLKVERAAVLDQDYVNGQVEYQRGNLALFQGEIQNGTDLDLKEFARQTLPKIQDHLQRALKLAEGAKPGAAVAE